MQVWDLAEVMQAGPGQAKPLQLQASAAVAAHAKEINAVAVSPKDALVCTGSQDRTAQVYSQPPAAAASASDRGIMVTAAAMYVLQWHTFHQGSCWMLASLATADPSIKRYLPSFCRPGSIGEVFCPEALAGQEHSDRSYCSTTWHWSECPCPEVHKGQTTPGMGSQGNARAPSTSAGCWDKNWSGM